MIVYGYGHARDRWSNMIILHICAEPFTAAMLEAALIERFEGNLAIFGLLSCTVNLGRIAFHECMGTMHIHVHTLMLEVCYHGNICFSMFMFGGMVNILIGLDIFTPAKGVIMKMIDGFSKAIIRPSFTKS